MGCPHHASADCPLDKLAYDVLDLVRRRDRRLSVIVLIVDSGDQGHTTLAVDNMPEDLSPHFLEEAAAHIRECSKARAS